MSTSIDSLRERFDALQVRERALLLAVILVLIYALFDLLWIGASNKAQERLQRELTSTQSTIDEGRVELSKLLAQVQQNANAPLQAQINQLNEQIAAEQQQLTSLTTGMVSAANLPRILEDVLVQTGKLKLLQLNALPVEELLLTAEDAEGEPRSAGVYKHKVRIVAEGGYSDLLAYLRALQALPWEFNWDQLHYQVDAFPAGRAELQVYTLTTEKGLFGNE